MPDSEKVLKGLECCKNKTMLWQHDQCPYHGFDEDCESNLHADALALLKEQEALKQKMWNALYAEEDKLEKIFVGTDEHEAWFNTYRPWLQRGFEIAIKVIAEQEGR